MGNRLTETWGPSVSTYTYQTGTNRLLNVTGPNPISFGYDGAGNVTSGSQTYAYNEANRLFSVNGQAIQYRTNYRGLRTMKTIGSNATYFQHDRSGHVLSEGPWPDPTIDYIYLDGEPVAKAAGSTLSFIHTDHLATPKLMTDAAGAVTWSIKTRPFGDNATITRTDTLNLRFPGQYYDWETSLHQNWWREYNPGIGRYMQVDPLPIESRPTGDTTAYSYVGNRPIVHTDPSGQGPIEASRP